MTGVRTSDDLAYLWPFKYMYTTSLQTQLDGKKMPGGGGGYAIPT